MDQFQVIRSRTDMADDLAAIQEACFPTLASAERITADQFRTHIKIFPEGQMTVLTDAGRPVASSTDLICNINLDHFQHRYMDASGNNWLTTHNPDGEWLYGVDIGVHPDWRGHGLSKLLYDARKNLARRLNLRGHIAGGVLKGYGDYKDRMSAENYIQQVKTGVIFDPTLSIQLRRGFKIHGIINDYLDDPSCDNKAALIVWYSSDYTD